MTKDYYVKIFERWEHGAYWGYKISTNDTNWLRQCLKVQYERFTIEEYD